MCVNKKIEIVIGIESSLVGSWTKMCLNADNITLFFLRSTFVGSAWSFEFFIPTTTANDLRL